MSSLLDPLWPSPRPSDPLGGVDTLPCPTACEDTTGSTTLMNPYRKCRGMRSSDPALRLVPQHCCPLPP